jgi:hypothetical protein
MSGKVLAKWAAAAAMACAGVAMAGSNDLTLAQQSTEPQVLADAAPRRPLMWALDQIGVAKTLDELNINIFGYVEGSYTYDMRTPPKGLGDDKIITGRAFDFEHSEAQLNQADIAIERTVDVTKKTFDVGARVEFVYGADARVIHSNGLNFYGPNSAGGSRKLAPGIEAKPDNQFDLEQAYVDVAVPVGNGLRIRAGKFVTLAGYETINPTTNPLYSHSYLFTFAIPFTQTGIYGTYAINDQFSVDLGIDRGWDQSLQDNNGSIGGFGRVSYASNDKKTNVYATVLSGPQLAKDSSHYRTTLDLVASYQWSDQILFGVNGDYDYGAHEAHDGDNAQYYGVALYATWKLNDYVSVNGRGEWFDDSNGVRIAARSANYYEGTLGLLITPFPNDALGSNLKVRPEVRYDYASRSVFDAGKDNYQVTAALETYFTY